MKAAIISASNITMSKNAAYKSFGFNKAISLRHLKNSNKYANGGKTHIGRQTDSLEEVENKLAKHIFTSSDGRVVRASVWEAVESGMIPSRVKPMT